MNVIYYILFFILSLCLLIFKSVEGFDNNYSNYIPPIYKNDAVQSNTVHEFGFHKGKGSYKSSKVKDNKSDDKISLLNELLDKFLNKIVSNTQDCVGDFGEYSECDKSCGTGGLQTRTYNVTQERGENGLACKYDDGYEEHMSCFIRDCEENDECETNRDCITGNCNPDNNKCGPKVKCTEETSHVCDQGECRRLNEDYGNASHVLDGKYLYDLKSERCFFKTPAEMEELNVNMYSYNYNNPDSFSLNQECSYYEKKSVTKRLIIMN